MLEFGFTDALNRRKLEVPSSDDSEKKSRLCNVFDPRVMRKLGLEAGPENQGKTESEKLGDLKNWIKSKKDMFDTAELKAKIAELGFVDAPETIIQRLINDGAIGAWNYIENLGVPE